MALHSEARIGLAVRPVCFNQDVKALVPKQDLLPEYLLYALQARSAEILDLVSSAGSGTGVLNTQLLKRLPIWVPDASAQRRIVAAIDSADGYVAALARMIAKKQAIQQGIMQHLLIRQARDTDTVSLGTVTSWLSGGTPDRANASFWSGRIPWISATTLKQIEVSDSDQKVSVAAVRSGSKMAPLNSTLLLVRGSALHSEVRASLVTAPVCFNQDVKALIPSPRLVPKFLTYSIRGNASKLLRLVTSAGNTAGVLDTPVLKSFTILLPSRSDQKHIVSILDDTTQEIAKLGLRLTKAQAMKQGMLQELLTGRTRLPVEESVP
jgi:type I restriction enzyme S subunit